MQRNITVCRDAAMETILALTRRRKAKTSVLKETIMLLSIIRALKAFRDYQRNLNELSQLTDHELADIGLRRSEIHSVAAGTYQK